MTQQSETREGITEGSVAVRDEGDAGAAEPGTAEPGTAEPGTAEPGTAEPGTAEPGVAGAGGLEVRRGRGVSPGPGRGRRWRRALTMRGEAGMATAEYAIATVAAAGFAGLLLLVLRSDEVRGALTAIVRSALAV